MTQDDVLFGYRVRLFALARRGRVSEACRLTYYRWKGQVERQGLEMLRPRERRRPQMPNQIPQIVEERMVAFSLGHPGLGPRRMAAMLARPEWGALRVSPNGVWKVLRRHGISTRAERLSLIAGYRATVGPPRHPDPEPRITTTRPGELVGIDCFFVGRLSDTKGAVWQITAIDTYSSYAWTDLVRCKTAGPTSQHTIPLTRRVAAELAAARWRLERVLTNNGNEFRVLPFGQAIDQLGARHSRIRAGRPQTNGHGERLHRTILEECWRPAFARFHFPGYTGLKGHLDAYITYTTTTARTPDRRRPGDARPTSSTVPARWSRDEPPLSAQLGGCSP